MLRISPPLSLGALPFWEKAQHWCRRWSCSERWPLRSLWRAPEEEDESAAASPCTASSAHVEVSEIDRDRRKVRGVEYCDSDCYPHSVPLGRLWLIVKSIKSFHIKLKKSNKYFLFFVCFALLNLHTPRHMTWGKSRCGLGALLRTSCCPPAGWCWQHRPSWRTAPCNTFSLSKCHKYRVQTAGATHKKLSQQTRAARNNKKNINT